MKRFTETQELRLWNAVDWSIRQLQYPRDKRVEAIKQMVGRHYARDGAQKNNPVNSLKMLHDVYVRSLAARAPRALITTNNPELRSIAANLELAVNQIPEEVNLEETMREMVSEALFGMGVVRVGLTSSAEILGHAYGRSFVDVVTFDDYFVDMSAKRWDSIQFEGNDYWPTVDEILEFAELPRGELQDIVGDVYPLTSEQGQSGRADSISIGGSSEEFKPRIWARDIWLPDEGLLLTYGVKSRKLLLEREWDGPDGGPYHRLMFGKAPGNLLPLPYVAVWRDLNELANAIFRKLAVQADSQKRVLGMEGASPEEVEAFRNAQDGGGIRWSNVKTERLEVGGVDPALLAFYGNVKVLLSYFGGNLDALAGLAPQTETVGQDRLIAESASAMLRDMAAAVTKVVKGIFRHLCYYEWHDPVRSRVLEKSVPQYPDLRVFTRWTPQSRQGKLEDYNLDIDIYSETDNSPSVRLQKLSMLTREFVFPLAPLIRQQGGEIDVQSILNAAAKYMDFDEARQIVFFAEPGPASDQVSDQMTPLRSPTPATGSSSGGQPQASENAVLKQLLAERASQASAG